MKKTEEIAKYFRESVSFNFNKADIHSFAQIEAQRDSFYALVEKEAFTALVDDFLYEDENRQLRDILIASYDEYGIRCFAEKSKRGMASLIIGQAINKFKAYTPRNVVTAVNSWIRFFDPSAVIFPWTSCPLCGNKIFPRDDKCKSCHTNYTEFWSAEEELSSLKSASTLIAKYPAFWSKIADGSEFSAIKIEIENNQNAISASRQVAQKIEDAQKRRKQAEDTFAKDYSDLSQAIASLNILHETTKQDNILTEQEITEIEKQLSVCDSRLSKVLAGINNEHGYDERELLPNYAALKLLIGDDIVAAIQANAKEEHNVLISSFPKVELTSAAQILRKKWGAAYFISRLKNANSGQYYELLSQLENAINVLESNEKKTLQKAVGELTSRIDKITSYKAWNSQKRDIEIQKQELQERAKLCGDTASIEILNIAFNERNTRAGKEKERTSKVLKISLPITISTLIASILIFIWGFLPAITLGFTWKVENSQITITGVKSDVTSIDIPEKARVSWHFTQLPVAAVASNAFKDNVQLRQISLPSTVNKIGENSFAGCTSLSYVYLASESVPSAGVGVFSVSSNLNIMVVPSLYSSYNRDSEWAQYGGMIYPNYNNSSGYYCVVIDVNGGSDISAGENTGLNRLDNNNQIFSMPQVSAGTMLNIKEPTLHGYTFAGWELPSGEIFSLTTTVSRNIKLKARWVPQDRSLLFEYNGATSGNELQNKNISYDIALGQLPEPQKTGYTFVGWYNNSGFTGNMYTSETIFRGLEDIKLYAKWQANVYTITFDYQDGRANTTVNIEYDSTIGNRLPTNVIKPGDNDFGGWWTGIGGSGVRYTSETVYLLSQNVTLYAKWETTVAFDYQGGDSTGLTDGFGIIYNTLVTGIPVTVTRSGYTFDGWWTEIGGGGKQITNNALYVESGAVILYAKWKTTITLNSVGGVVNPAQIEVVYNRAIGILPDPTKSNVVFDGWFTSETYTTKYTNSTVYTEEGAITLYAKWTATLIFDYQGATAGNSTLYITVSNGDFIGAGRLPQPTKTGYKFGGWFEQADGVGMEYTPVTKFVGGENLVVYAYWILETYRVSFDSNGGNSVSDINTHFGDNLADLSMPTREGYRFDGWFFSNVSGNGSGTPFTAGIVGDLGDWPTDDISSPIPVTVYAKWTLKTFTFMFVSNNGSAAENREVNYGVSYSFGSSTRTGYHFDGWYRSNTSDNGSGVLFPISGIMPDMGEYGATITLYAKWILEQYRLKFNANGGSTPSDVDTYFGHNLTSLPTSTRDGYRFDGWFLSNTSGNGSGTQLTTGVVGDLAHWPSNDTSAPISVNLYAKWTKITADFYGSGTEVDPYRIYDVHQLRDLSDQVNAGNNFSGKRFALQANILSVDSWTPIGNNNHETYYSTSSAATSRRFAGVFDGKGFTIGGYAVSRASQTRTDTYSGLFGYIATGGVVKNLKVSDVSIDGSSTRNSGSKGGAHHGAIAGVNSGIISNCEVLSGTVTGLATLDTHNGGIAGYVFLSGAQIIDSKNAATISGTAGRCTSHGGIVGSVNNGVIYRCSNSGAVSGTTNGTASYSGAGTNYRFHGGIAGVACALIVSCSNSGSITSGNVAYYGGGAGIIVGYLHNGSDSSIGSTGDNSLLISQIPGYAHYSAVVNCSGSGASYFIGFLQNDSGRQSVAVSSNNNSVWTRMPGAALTTNLANNYYDTYLSSAVNIAAMLATGYIVVPANFIIKDELAINPNDGSEWYVDMDILSTIILVVSITFGFAGTVLITYYFIRKRKRVNNGKN